MSVAEELQKLQQLYESGAINNDEYVLAKAKLLNERPAPAPLFGSPPQAANLDAAGIEQETRQWAMFLHLSVLAGVPRPIRRPHRADRDLATQESRVARH
jgi:hypothetical protein